MAKPILILFDHLIAPAFWCFDPLCWYSIPSGSQSAGSKLHRWWEKFAKWCEIGRWLLWNANRKSWVLIDVCQFQWPWVASDPDFKVTTFFKSNIGKTAILRDRVTTDTNRKLYLTYWNGTMFGDLDWPLKHVAAWVCQHQLSFFILFLLSHLSFWYGRNRRAHAEIIV